jgi:hypothetical protein
VWKYLCGDGWLITAIQTFEADGHYITTTRSKASAYRRVHARSRATDDNDNDDDMVRNAYNRIDPEVYENYSAWRTDLFKQVQRNKLFSFMGLPHRLMALIHVYIHIY